MRLRDALTGNTVDDEKYSALESPMSVILAQQSRLSRMLDAFTSLQRYRDQGRARATSRVWLTS